MRSVLAVGAHPADIELGCAGTLAAHRAAGDAVTMLVLADGRTAPDRRVEAQTAGRVEAEAAGRALDCLLVWGHLVDGAVTSDATTIAAIENVISGVGADVVYVHAPDDSHCDHRAAAAATLSAARHSSRVLHYRSDSTVRFEPSVYVDVSAYLDRKLTALACHRGQGSAMGDPEVVAASARHFGAQARVRYAEAFVPARFVWNLAPLPQLPIEPDLPAPVARVPVW